MLLADSVSGGSRTLVASTQIRWQKQRRLSAGSGWLFKSLCCAECKECWSTCNNSHINSGFTTKSLYSCVGLNGAVKKHYEWILCCSVDNVRSWKNGAFFFHLYKSREKSEVKRSETSIKTIQMLLGWLRSSCFALVVVSVLRSSKVFILFGNCAVQP